MTEGKGGGQEQFSKNAEQESVNNSEKNLDEIKSKLEKFYPQLYRHCCRLAGIDRGEDLAQNVMLTAVKSLKNYKEGNLAGWLYGICRNKLLEGAKSYYAESYPDRDSSRKVLFSKIKPSEKLAHSPLNPEQLFQRREEWKFVRESLKGLTEKDRRVFLMRFEEELSYEDIAQRLNITVSNVKSCIHRVRNRLEKFRSVMEKNKTKKR